MSLPHALNREIIVAGSSIRLLCIIIPIPERYPALNQNFMDGQIVPVMLLEMPVY
jgi:hypothetical protein